MVAAQQAISDEIKPKLDGMKIQLDEFSAETEQSINDLEPKFNSIAAQVQLNSKQSQCREAPVCDDSGTCTSANKAGGTVCDDYNADTTGDTCVSGTCAGNNLCDGVKCPAAKVCHDDNYCFRGKCLHGAAKVGTACEYAFEDGSKVAGQCSDAGACSPPAPKVTSISPNVVNIPGATTVTVTGSNFRMGSMLEFNGVSMPTAWRGTTILVADHPATADTSKSDKHSLGILTPGEGRTIVNNAYTVRERLAPWNRDPWGNGKDGKLDCNSMAQHKNKAKAWRVSATIKFGQKSVSLGANPGSALSKGDKVLLHVAQDFEGRPGSDDASAGLHELLIVTKVDGTTVSVESAAGGGVSIFNPKKGQGHIGSLTSWWAQRRVVLQRVPQYTEVNMPNCILKPAGQYNAQDKTGEVNTGIIAFSVQNLIRFGSSGGIDVSMQGHRGAKVPNKNRCAGGCKVRTPGRLAADAFYQSVVKSNQDAVGRGKSNQWGGDGGMPCPDDRWKTGAGGKGGCHHDPGCSQSVGGKGRHGGGGGGRDWGYQGGGGGGGSFCPGAYYTFPQSNAIDGAGLVDKTKFQRIIHGGGASTGGGGGRSTNSNSGGNADGTGAYRSSTGHGGGDGGHGAPGGGIIYILAKDGLTGGGTLKADGGHGGGGGGGELGSHKFSGGGGGGGGNGGSGGTIVVVTSKNAAIRSQGDVKTSVKGGAGGGGGGGGGVPNQHNPTASGAGGGGAIGFAGAPGGGGGGGSPSAGGPYRGGDGSKWMDAIKNSDGSVGAFLKGSDGNGGRGGGKYPGGGGGCSEPGGKGGEPYKGGRGSSSSRCGGRNFGKDATTDNGGAGGEANQACGTDSNSGAGGGGGGRGATGIKGSVFFAVSER